MTIFKKVILIIISIAFVKLFFIDNKESSGILSDDKDTYWISTIELY